MEWLDESEKNLDSEVEIANEPDKIKAQLAQHKVRRHLQISVYGENNTSFVHLTETTSRQLFKSKICKMWP